MSAGSPTCWPVLRPPRSHRPRRDGGLDRLQGPHRLRPWSLLFVATVALLLNACSSALSAIHGASGGTGLLGASGPTVPLGHCRAPVSVSDLVGDSVWTAEWWLRQSGLQFRIGPQEVTTRMASGNVASTSPPPGSELTHCSAVVVLTTAVSAAVPSSVPVSSLSPSLLVDVPLVVGDSVPVAIELLEKARLKPAPTLSYRCSEVIGPGNVLWTPPAPGTAVVPGRIVELVVASSLPAGSSAASTTTLGSASTTSPL